MLTIRNAIPADGPLIHRFITQLAIYEREPDAVETTPEELSEQLSQQPPPFECLIAEHEGEPAGFALFFHNYSTWKGRAGIYLEDLFVMPAYRGRGIGKALFIRVAQLANQRDCARYEWAALNWNTPAIDFYRSFGAQPLSEWTTFRLTGDKLAKLGIAEG